MKSPKTKAVAAKNAKVGNVIKKKAKVVRKTY